MEKKVYKYENWLRVRYSPDLCKDIFFFSVVENRTMQSIQHEAAEEWVKRKKAEREKMRERLSFIDKD
jgi:hypothetical protein